MEKGQTVQEHKRRVLDVQLDLLAIFNNVCVKYNLDYYLWSDTLVGAVRHKGQIPWDNGMEVAMPRKHFDKLCQIAEKVFAEPYCLQTNYNDSNFFSGGLCRLRNNETTGVEVWDLEYKCNWGIWIDIVALNNIFEDERKRQKQLRKVSFYQYLSLMHTYGNKFYGYQNLSSLKKSAYKLITKMTKRSWVLRLFDRACTSCDESAYLGVFARYTNISNFRCLFAEDFSSILVVDFENMKMPIPKGYRRYLQMVRGNFMEIPSIENQVPRYPGIFLPDLTFKPLQKLLTGAFDGAENKKIILWGTGNIYESYMQNKGNDYPPEFLVDSNPKKWGCTLQGRMIKSPEVLKNIPSANLRIIICSSQFREIEKELRRLKIENYYLYIRDVLEVKDILYPKNDDKKEETVMLAEKEQTNSELDGTEGSGEIRENNKRHFLKGKAGLKISPNTGYLESGYSAYMSTPFFYKAKPGNCISLLDRNFCFAVATYSLDAEAAFNTGYREDENWSIYDHNFNDESFIQKDYVFREEKYFRICLKKVDNKDIFISEAQGIDKIVQFMTYECENLIKEYFIEEIERVAATVMAKRGKNSFVFALLSDSHYTVNGTWKETIQNVNALHEKVGFDAIIHLGDFTDGIVPADVTKEYVKKMIQDLRGIPIPLYLVVGNHDSNYFWYNPEIFSKEEEYRLYLDHVRQYVQMDHQSPWYYVDFDNTKIRGIFLDSFNGREHLKYGFQKSEVEWLEKILDATPTGTSIVVFSHVPPLDEIHCLNDRHTIQNGAQIIEILETYNAKKENKVLAFFYGHNHLDQVYTKRGFPIIGIACNKCEFLNSPKVKGGISPRRKLYSKTQDLWDVVILDSEVNEIELVRFGAGADRTVIGY